MIAIHGSEDAVRIFMANSARKVKDRSKGGFHRLTGTQELKDISRKAALKRWSSNVNLENTDSNQ